ncbi:hypothetical protein [Nocardiopsis dassonvillei]|uniref:hypothetical protein n=1 Tax=Nocardiopsis dassonvillei TaxID=2014 RepID=UPI003F58010B
MNTENATTKTNGPHEPYRGRGRGEERDGRGAGSLRRFTVHHDGVTIPVTRGGRWSCAPACTRHRPTCASWPGCCGATTTW